jgi:hypothetical protein
MGYQTLQAPLYCGSDALHGLVKATGGIQRIPTNLVVASDW